MGRHQGNYIADRLQDSTKKFGDGAAIVADGSKRAVFYDITRYQFLDHTIIIFCA
jgi:hypothetical protein